MGQTSGRYDTRRIVLGNPSLLFLGLRVSLCLSIHLLNVSSGLGLGHVWCFEVDEGSRRARAQGLSRPLILVHKGGPLCAYGEGGQHA